MIPPASRSLLIWIALTGLAFGGRLCTTDVLAQLQVAQSFTGARPFLTASDGWTVEGVDGRSYVPHGIGYSILLLPAALAGLAAGEAVARVSAALTCAALSACLFAVWRPLCVSVNGAPPPAWKAIAVMTGGMALVYARLPFDVTAAALLCTASLAAASSGRDRIAGFLIGAALLVRLDSAVFLPSLVYGWRRGARLVPGVACALVLIAAANLYRFGSVLEDGHSQDPAMALEPGLAGLAGLLASPGKGLVWFAPIVLPAASRHRGWRLAAPLAFSLVLHSMLHDWTGGTGWGPRFLFPALPAFLVPLAAPRREGGLFGLTAAWGVILTVAAVWSNPSVIERSLGADAFEDPSRQAVIWQPSRSPLLHSVSSIGSGAPDLFCLGVLAESRTAGTAACIMQGGWVLGALALARARRREDPA